MWDGGKRGWGGISGQPEQKLAGLFNRASKIETAICEGKGRNERNLFSSEWYGYSSIGNSYRLCRIVYSKSVPISVWGVIKKIGGTELPVLSCEMDGQPGWGGIRNRDGDYDNKIWQIMFEYD